MGINDFSKITQDKRFKEHRLIKRDANKQITYTEDADGERRYDSPITQRVRSLNGLTGAVNITEGDNVTVSVVGQSIEIASTGGFDLPDFMDVVDTPTAEGIAVFDDPPTNSNMVALIGKKGSETEVYKETVQADFEKGELEDVEATSEGLELDLGPKVFTSDGEFTPPPGVNKVNVLVVAGGGGGGSRQGGGGGAGGVIWETDYDISALASPISVTVGDGGAGGTSGGRGTNGQNSVFGGLTAIGGGAGGGRTSNNAGLSGGSGGGSANNNATRAAGTAGQGNAGGRSAATTTGGGGGGKGANGADSTSTLGGNGGAGQNLSSVFGTAIGDDGWFGGGGGGGTFGGTRGVGGKGGGGDGRDYDGPGGTGNGHPGMDNTGGGGGGSDLDSTAGGKGGSGIVIVQYVKPLHGNRIALPQDLTTLSTDPGLEIQWTATKPAGADVTIETAVKGETSHTDEAVGTGDGAEDTFYLDYYPAERHSDVVVSVDGTPTAEFTRANANDPREITFNAGHEPAGPPTYKFLGAWITGTAYVEDDCVFYDSDTWRAKRTVVATTTEPAENDDWTEIVTGSYAFPVPAGVTSVRTLVVAGGGGGGGNSGFSAPRASGGGAAGGLIYDGDYSVTPGGTVSVTVGDGGTGTNNGTGIDGDNSVFGTLTAIGGGGGGGNAGGASGPHQDGADGGSGGGAGREAEGGSGQAGQGNDGGDGASNDDAGSGGGGAGGPGEAGVDGDKAGDGGAGLEYFGSYYAGGGGGAGCATRTEPANGSGGIGGGGDAGQDADANTGGGGGAGGTTSAANAGKGGSGIVIVQLGEAEAVTATYTGVVEPDETAEVQTLYLGDATGGTYELGITGDMKELAYDSHEEEREYQNEGDFDALALTFTTTSDLVCEVDTTEKQVEDASIKIRTVGNNNAGEGEVIISDVDLTLVKTLKFWVKGTSWRSGFGYPAVFIGSDKVWSWEEFNTDTHNFDWYQVEIDLSGYTGSNNVRFMFIDPGGTGWDNRTVWYDDIQITAGVEGFTALLEGIFGEGLVTVEADTDFTITFSVRVRDSELTADFTSLTGATSPTLTVTTAYDSGDWEEQTSGTEIDNIPAGDLTGKHLWIRQTLETDGTAETPILEEVTVCYGAEEYGVFTFDGTVKTL